MQNDCFSATVSIVGQPSSRSERKQTYKRLYFEIIDTIITMLNDRFADCATFEFLHLVNPRFLSHCQNNVEHNKLQLLNDKYGPQLKANYFSFTVILIFTKKAQWNFFILTYTQVSLRCLSFWSWMLSLLFQVHQWKDLFLPDSENLSSW